MPCADPKLAVQVIVVVPQPDVIVTVEISLEFGITVSGARPVR